VRSIVLGLVRIGPKWPEKWPESGTVAGFIAGIGGIPSQESPFRQ
jgi:hypothetical protein